MSDSDDNSIKIILLGESGVGKTNLINVFFGREFNQHSEATSMSYNFEGEINYKKKPYKYFIWDTCGMEKYRSINKMFIRDSKIILIVYSIVDKRSFNEVDFWINFVKENVGSDKYIIALVANKSDLFEEQIVMEEDGREIAEKYGIEFFTTSASTNSKPFQGFVNKLIINYIDLSEKKEEKKVEIKEAKIDEKKEEKSKKKCNIF